MSHSVVKKSDYVWRIPKQWACVTVVVDEKFTKGKSARKLVIQPQIGIVQVGTAFVKLSNDWIVVDDEGNKMPAEHQFWVSVSTIDPFHILIDFPPDSM